MSILASGRHLQDCSNDAGACEVTSLCGSLLRQVYGIICDKREEPTYPELEISKMARQEHCDFLVVMTLH